MAMLASVVLSIIVGLYTGIIVMRISSFHQYKIYALEIIFGISTEDFPKEEDFEPKVIDIVDGEPEFFNEDYNNAVVNYHFFGSTRLGDYHKLMLVSNIFKGLNHRQASSICIRVYQSINDAANRIHEAQMAEFPNDNVNLITPKFIHELHPKWDAAIVNMKPDWLAIFKPFSHSKISL